MTIKVPAEHLVIQDAQITYRNFAGVEGQYNVKGARNFAVWINTREEAEALEVLGWKIKYTKVREDGEEARYPAYMPVSVKYHPKMAPPRVKMITSRGQNSLDEEAIDVLDFVSIKKCDMILRPFHWTMKSGEGVKNMLVSIYVTVQEDELELKYADVPEIGPGSNQRAIESSDVWGTGLEDMGEIVEEDRRAIGSGRGF